MRTAVYPPEEDLTPRLDSEALRLLQRWSTEIDAGVAESGGCGIEHEIIVQ